MPSVSVPDFESDLLWDIAIATARRGKAIRYHGSLECTREIEDHERLNLDFEDIHGWRVSFSIWSNAVFWLGITKAGPRHTGGWAYCDEFHGNLGDLTAHDVVERFERTILSPTEARNFWPPFSDKI